MCIFVFINIFCVVIPCTAHGIQAMRALEAMEAGEEAKTISEGKVDELIQKREEGIKGIIIFMIVYLIILFCVFLVLWKKVSFGGAFAGVLVFFVLSCIFGLFPLYSYYKETEKLNQLKERRQHYQQTFNLPNLGTK
jgi:ABC-type transport system involved in cytochrome bd biosynthesis fused ATPase/permease subunit